MGLYVPLDVEYASDDRIMEAGAMPELLYIRALCWCKKNPKTDGAFSWAQLSTFAHGIKSARTHAETLIETGLFEATDKGARVSSWLKRNKSGEDIMAAQAMASVLGQQGNHERWHTGPEGKPSPKCPLCLASHKSGAPIAPRSAPPIGVASPKEKEEEKPKEEPKGKEEEEGTPVVSADMSKSEATPAPDDDMGSIIDQIITRCAHRRTEAHRPDNPTAYKTSIEADMNRTERDAIATMLRERPFLRTQPEKAATRYELARRDAQRAGA